MMSSLRSFSPRRLVTFALVICFLYLSALGLNADASSVLFAVPENNAVPLSESSNYTDVVIKTPANISISAKKYFGSSTPSAYSNASSYDATLVKSSSYYYNCHGFAWYFGGKTTGLTNAKAFWMDSAVVTKYVQHSSCFQRVNLGSSVTCAQLVDASNRSLLRVGDIILYKNGDATMSNSLYSHSAVIVSISSSGVYVNSKWGVYGLYKHKVEQCPYAETGYIDGNSTISDYAQVVVYRPVHSNVNNSVLPTATSSTVYTLPSYVTIDDSTHKAVCSCGRGYTTEDHNFTQITTYRFECDDCGHIYNSNSSVNSSDGSEGE